MMHAIGVVELMAALKDGGCLVGGGSNDNGGWKQ